MRELEDWIVGVHRYNATHSGPSLEEHLRNLLRESPLQSQARFADEAEVLLAAAKKKYGCLPSSTNIIREQREAL